MVVPGGGGGEGGELLFNGVGLSFGTRGSGHGSVTAVKQCRCTECCWTVRLKMVKVTNFILCVFGCNKNHIAK